MRRVLLVVGALILLASAALTATKFTAAPAGAATAQITVQGSTVAGMKTAQSGVQVMLDFKVINSGSTTYGGSGLYFMSYYVSSNASITSVECVQNVEPGLVPRRYDVGPTGSNGCELEGLRPGATNQGAIDIQVGSDPPDLTVEACVGLTPGSKTYCGTVVVPLLD